MTGYSKGGREMDAAIVETSECNKEKRLMSQECKW